MFLQKEEKKMNPILYNLEKQLNLPIHSRNDRFYKQYIEFNVENKKKFSELEHAY